MFANVGYAVYDEIQPTPDQLSLAIPRHFGNTLSDVAYPVETYFYLVVPDWAPEDESFTLTYEYEDPPFVEDVVYDSILSEVVVNDELFDLGVIKVVLSVIEPILDVITDDALDEAFLEEPPPIGAAAGLVTIYIQNPPITHEYLTNLQAFVEIEEQFGIDLSFPYTSDETVPVITDINEITNLAALVEYEDEPGLDRVEPDEADTNLPDLTIIPFLLDGPWIDEIPETPSLEEEGDMRFETYDETMVLEHGARISLVTDRTQTYIAGHGLAFEWQLWIEQTPTDDAWSGASGDADQWTNAARPASQWTRVVRTPPDSGIETVPVPGGPGTEPPPSTYVPSLDFSDYRNSQYLGAGF